MRNEVYEKLDAKKRNLKKSISMSIVEIDRVEGAVKDSNKSEFT